jgi:hypothetical protein
LARVGISELERLSEKVPPLAWAKVQRERFEQQVLRRLRQRMDQATGDADQPSTVTSARGVATGADGASPAQVLGSLLETGLRQTAEQAREATLLRAVRELVPDEAKLLTAMVGDEGHAMLHVDVGGRRILNYVTAAARAANVKSREMAERYIFHLIDLGLIADGPEDTTIPLEYELLEGSTAVREVLDGARRRRLIGRVRIQRGTVRLTALGEALWTSYSGDVLEATDTVEPREETT